MMKHHGLILIFSCVAALVIADTTSLAQARGIPADKKAEIFDALNRGVPHVSNEILVQFSASATQSDKARALRLIVGQRKEVVVSKEKQSVPNAAPSDRGDLEIVTLPRGLAVSTALRAIERDSAVLFAEPNWIYQHQQSAPPVSADPRVSNGELWGMLGDSAPSGLYTNVTFNRTNAFGSQATEAWGAGNRDCSAVFVGIIDEGYMLTHSDLASNVGKNPGEIEGNGVDDDDNGYVDDVYGWDFDGNNNTVFDGLGDDHGTHVAGTIGAVGGNGIGVAGVCWKVKLLNAKFLGSNGGTTANAIKAVDYFTDLKLRHGLRIVATNNSWGGGGESLALQAAIERANAENILFIAAAGNSSLNCETSSCYPAEYPNANVIAVASITSTGGLSSFSNYGSLTVDIGAPGSNIWSTVPVRSKGVIISGYASYNGTSMATPHVSGAAALYKALNPLASAAQVKAAILGPAVETTSIKGKVSSNGRLNVSGFARVPELQSPPSP